MANQWLRLWHDMPTDPKWRTIARASEQPISLVQAVYLHLLVDASRNVTRGHATVTAEDLASALDVTEDSVKAILAAMQGRVIDEMRLLGWEARQPKREDGGSGSTEAKSAAQRQAEKRQRDRENAEKEDCHAASRNVTLDKDKEESKKKKKPASPAFALPDWIPAEPWSGYTEMRSKKRAPMTDRARDLVIAELLKFKNAGHDVATVLDLSTKNNWTDVYEPKTAPRSQADTFAGAL